MKTDLFFYTGTGNSLWAARTLAKDLGNAAITPLLWVTDNPIQIHGDAVGIIFPVHIWGLPQRIIDFIYTLPIDQSMYYFAFAVNAGQVAATLLQMDNLMASRGLLLSAGFDICMPSNYIPWGGPGPEEMRMKRIHNAEEKIRRISSIIAKRERHPVEKGPLWQNILFTWFYKLSFPHIPTLDKKFWADNKCNSCGICKNICPCGNIVMEAGKPVWLHHCEQCLACIQWCPQEAIQYGTKTPLYERYHHPEVTIEEVLSISRKASRTRIED